MTDRAIIFSAPMVKALLAGRKTQTRRILKPRVQIDGAVEWCRELDARVSCGEANYWTARVGASTYTGRAGPLCEVGDRLYVRENFTTIDREIPTEDGRYFRRVTEAMFAADYAGFDKPDRDWNWSPCIHMPRALSRLTLVVTDVRVQRLQECSRDAAVAEGLCALSKDGKIFKYGISDKDGLPGQEDHGWPWHKWQRDPVLAYSALWNQINGAGAWEANPWIVAVSFTVAHGNIDKITPEQK